MGALITDQSLTQMGKITFRADDDLVERLEGLDASKSEVMREALRAYLDESSDAPNRDEYTAIDDIVRERIDDLLAERLDHRSTDRRSPDSRSGDVNITVSLEGGPEQGETRSQNRSAVTDSDRDQTATPTPSVDHETTCAQCGDDVDADHVYCPNCGEKTSKRLFCECGDELRSDWSFCPSCGRRTPAADVLGADRPE